MWILKDINGGITYLKPNKTLSIGRKKTNIILNNDSSISRIHAIINVILKDEMKIFEESSKIFIKDTNSKYGTSVTRNGIQIKVTNHIFELQQKDIVKFGLQNQIFKVEYMYFVTVTSRLSTYHYNQLKDIMGNIGGVIIDYYDDYCTHLTTTTGTCTNKIISAAISGKPIINITYWSSVQTSIELNKDLPNPILFTVPLQDKGINSKYVTLKPNSLRKTIFAGKTFIFFSKETYKEYNNIITKAGGKIELYNMDFTNISQDLFADNNIIMQISNNGVKNNLSIFNTILCMILSYYKFFNLNSYFYTNKTNKQLQKRGMRLIAETEIPLAILYVSLNQFCNPKYHFQNLMKRNVHKNDTSKILALDTQDIPLSVPHKINVDTRISNTYLPETDYFIQESIINNMKNQVHNSINKICNSKNKMDLPIIDLKKNESPLLIADSMNYDFIKHNFEKVEIFNIKEKKQNSKVEIINKHILEKDLVYNKTQKNYNSENLSMNQKLNFGSKKLKEAVTASKNIKLEPYKSEIKKKKDTYKWKFKVFEKKKMDFNFDERDIIELKSKNNLFENVDYMNEKCKKVAKAHKKVNLSDLIESNKNNKVINVKLLNTDRKFSDVHIKASTITELSRITNFSENTILIKNVISNKFEIRSNISKTSNKVFKKVYKQMPKKRIFQMNMTIWKSDI